MITEPKTVYPAFRSGVERTASKVVEAIAAGKPLQLTMKKNVASMIDEHCAYEFDCLLECLKKDYPEIANDLEKNTQFVSGHALRRYAYTGTAKIG